MVYDARCINVSADGFLHLLKMEVAQGKSLNLAWALNRTRHFGVTLDHDRVYGMLGLVFHEAVLNRVVIDYPIPVGDLYTIVAKLLIENLRVIGCYEICQGLECQGEV